MHIVRQRNLNLKAYENQGKIWNDNHLSRNPFLRSFIMRTADADLQLVVNGSTDTTASTVVGKTDALDVAVIFLSVSVCAPGLNRVVNLIYVRL